MEQPEQPPLAGTLSVPVACDPRVFTRAERAEHLALCVDVLVRWPKRRIELDDGYLFEFEGDEERFLVLARWAAAEHRCCPWGSYSVEMGPFAAGARGEIRVKVRSTREGKEFLAAAYQYLKELGGAAPPEAIMDAKEKLTVRSLVQRLKESCGC